ncbi:putative Ycf35 (chloroplast) [Thalassiosira oceanica CCMP1005]|uniref:Ycf35 n=2 Tax=Thalassiosira oceanica TaxID=159749 RepID=A0ACA6S1E9_THAOC|nr:putative Ycf35 [Thalassiosira oceanica CCMP1005]YP_004072652.1 putative Ycf35 [Thalassiosira oceanica CCMP1005]ADB27564.1 putative Ycf35 [Thalassiosira oceanica CCMP1005]ADB27605.1 putative Ycf35 [Thalassiosira oceanica CCMP1005]|eukprot:ADB27564.1 putative Ycf35 (chloroplast) [Thalassiosira oceanica CCMP1005]
MSHFTNLKTSFKNLLHLENALKNLGIKYKKSKKIINNDQNMSKRYNDNVIIPQSNNYDITFDWNGEEYDLVLDASFWIQPYPVESFINKLSQQYANDVIITESQKIGFQPIKSKQHIDGSNTITLQRWNANTIY